MLIIISLNIVIIRYVDETLILCNKYYKLFISLNNKYNKYSYNDKRYNMYGKIPIEIIKI